MILNGMMALFYRQQAQDLESAALALAVKKDGGANSATVFLFT